MFTLKQKGNVRRVSNFISVRTSGDLMVALAFGTKTGEGFLNPPPPPPPPSPYPSVGNRNLECDTRFLMNEYLGKQFPAFGKDAVMGASTKSVQPKFSR